MFHLFSNTWLKFAYLLSKYLDGNFEGVDKQYQSLQVTEDMKAYKCSYIWE